MVANVLLSASSIRLTSASTQNLLTVRDALARLAINLPDNVQCFGGILLERPMP